MPTRSFSKDEIPRPIPAATAMAAGTRTTDSEGVNRPVHPCVAANASTHEAEAIAHKRAAHTRRTPFPSRSGNAAPASNSHTMGDRTVGPMAKRVTSPHPGAAAAEIGRPKISTAFFPARTVPTAQGAQSTTATPTALTASHMMRPAFWWCPAITEPRAMATATARVIGRTAGANEVARAMMAPSATV
jgi:hypothetical protein